MRTVTCPECGRSGKIPDDYAGTRAKCPKCSAVIDVPPPADFEDEPLDLGIEFGDAADEPTAVLPRQRTVTSPAPIKPTTPAVYPGPSPAASGLPWFYGYLSVVSHLCMIAGIVVGVVGAMEANGRTVEGRSSPDIALIVGFIGMTLTSFIVPAVILLALDIGKSLRAKRD